MADCNYRFRDTAGAWQTITGKPAMMAFLANGGLEQLLPGKVLPWNVPEKSEYPFGRVDQDDQFFGSRVRVLPELRGDSTWEGTVGFVLNGGRLIEVARDGNAMRVRISGDRIEVLSRIENGANKKPEDAAKAPIATEGRPNPGRYVQPRGDGSVQQQMDMANRGGTIAALSMLNDSAGNPYSYDEIQNVADDKIDALRDYLSKKAKGQQPTAESPKVEAKPTAIDDFGAKLAGARKDMQASLSYAKPSQIETPAQGVLANAIDQKERAWKQVKSLRQRIKGGETHLRLELLKAEDRWREAMRYESSAKDQIEADANRQGLTTKRLKFSRASKAMPDTITVDGVERPTTNSKGQPIHPTEAGVRNFWRWFGDSKVVDDQGRPLVVYHGTGAEFAEFSDVSHRSTLNDKYQGDGFHFSEDPGVASAYADAARNQFINKDRVFALVDDKMPPLAAKVFKAVVNDGYDAAWDLPDAEVAAILAESRDAGIDLNNLLDIAEAVEGTNYHKGRKQAFDAGMIFGSSGPSGVTEWTRKDAVSLGLQDALPNPSVMPVYLKAKNILRTKGQKAAKGAEANGYDGVYYYGEGTVRGVPEYIVFSPTQIKSAIGNTGAFDAQSPDIRFSKSPDAPTPAGITIDGVERPTTNSKGQPIHPTEEGVRNFYKWFGDSKVVDEQGRPLVVYHGSRNDFSVFDYSKIGEQGRGEGAGFYFTNSRDVASGYGKPMEVFLSIQKPLAYDAKPFTKPTIQKIVRRVAELEAKGEGGDIADGFLSNFGDVRSSGLQSVVRDAADLIAADETAIDQLSGIVGSGVNAQYVNRATTDVTGFDGVVADGFSNRGDGSNRIYVAFHPEQIKSATNNAGTFDPANPDIRRSAASPVPASGITAESLPAAFARRFPSLSGAIKTMLDRGALGQKGGLVVLDTNDETQIAREFADRTGRTFDETVQMFESGVGPEINGFYDALSGTTFLVGPNLDGDTASAVVMHEMVHGQQRRSLDEKALAMIADRAKAPRALGQFLTRVAQRMEDVDESGNASEATAYIVEMAVQEGRQAGFSAADGPILAWIEKNIGKPVADLVREFVAMARAWALAHGVELKRIAVDDLVAYAKLGLKRAADGRVVTFGRESGNIAAMSEREGVAGKQAPTPAGDVETGGAKPVVTLKAEKGTFGVKVDVGRNGRVSITWPGWGESSGALRDKASNAVMDAFRPQLPDGVYWRFTNNKNEAALAKQGELRASTDHSSGTQEKGLSVTNGAHYSVFGYKYGYQVRGEVIGYGADGEPLLDVSKLEPVTQVLNSSEVVTEDQRLSDIELQKKGWTRSQIKDFANGAFKIHDIDKDGPPNESPASDSPDVKFSRAALGPLSAAQQSTVERIFGKPKTLRERAESFAKDWQKNLVQGIFDQFAPIKEISSKGYIQARLAKGSDSTLEALLLYGKVFVDKDGAYQVDFDGENLNGFAKTMAKLDGEHDRFLAWVSGLRAERLSGVGLENLMTPEDIEGLKSLADGSTKSGKVRRALYAQALKDLNEFNDSVLKIAEDSGLIDAATRKMYQDTPYVPFYRLSEEDVIQGPSVSKGLVNQSAWKQLKGGTDKLNEDLMGNLLKNWSHLITASANNRAAKEVLDTAARMGAATDMTNDVVAQDINGQPIYRGNTKRLVRYRGEIKRKIPKGQPYIENGQTLISDGTAEISYVGDRYFKVDDPHLMDAISSIGFTTKVWKPMADFKRYLTFGVTVNPTFKIRNLIRDSIQAVGTAELSYNPVQNILMGAKGTAMMSNVRAQMLASGGMLRFGSAEGGYSGHVRRLIEKGVDPQYILDDDSKIKSFWKHKVLPAFEAYQELGDRSENVNRAALYEQLLTKGMSHAEASFWARDMMDFSMHGKWAAVRTLTSVVPFMNARLQGIYKLGRATKADYRRMGATLAAVSMASIGLMLAYGDDDDWKKREDWERDGSWWFKIAGVAFVIPKPFEVGAVGTIAERSVELMISDEMTGKRFGQRMRDLLMHNLSMNPTPQLIKPMIDLYANKDGFSGREIETQGMEKLRPEDRYTNRTSEVARFLGQIGLPNPAQLLMGRVEGLSPVQIDHLIRGYFAWVGTSATTALDYGIRPMMDRGDRPDMRLKDVFLVGNFVQSLPSGSSRYVTQFYEQAKEIEQMYASYQQAIKEGDTAKAKEIRDDNPEGFAARRRIEAAKRAQSMIVGQMRTIERDKTMTGDEKRARLDQLEKQRDRLARQALLVTAAPGRD